MFFGNGRHRRRPGWVPTLLFGAAVAEPVEPVDSVPLLGTTGLGQVGGITRDAVAQKPSLSVRGLTVRVKHGKGHRILLDKVSFTVPAQALIAVVGPSGCGKSTLLRALTGHQRNVEGEVLYEN